MDKETFVSKLSQILKEVSELHRTISEEWEVYASERGIEVFNQKAVKVSELESSGLINTVIEYRKFVINVMDFDMDERFDCDGLTVDARVKTHNSTLEKLDDYCTYSKEKGKVSTNKCFNDLFGMRLIVDCDALTFGDVERCLKGFSNLTIIDKHFELVRSVDTYVAIHIYFDSGRTSVERNRQFRWELQIWTKAQERNNHLLHKCHRFKYRDWEGGR